LEPNARAEALRKVERVDSATIMPELALLKAKLGVFSVLGNHDWYFGGYELRTQLEAAGITVLENNARSIETKGRRVWIAGLADAWERVPNMMATLLPIPESEPVILMTHNPDLFPYVPANVNLTVAGHTHGGQVSLPFIGPLVVPSQYKARYAKGLIVEKGRNLFVTSGIGTSVFPVRFGVPPEISYVILRAPQRVQE
jgi:predicted MPP superfamily phosphohydrolase